MGRVRKIEELIVKQVIKDLLAHDMKLRVWDGEDWAGPWSYNEDKIFGQMFATDEERLYCRDGETDEDMGWVFFVYGNDGYDVICDYTMRLEQILENANNLSKEWED